MSYDKLLKRIFKAIDEGYEYVDIMYMQALYNVVELHKPDKDMCPECEDAYYPCRTIQAIQKGLK
jgi:hypothetical protein